MEKIERNFDALIQEMSSTESLISSLEKQLTEANDHLVDLKDQKRYMFGNDNLYVNMESLLNKYDFDGDGVISIIDYYIWYGFNNNDSFVIDNPKYNNKSKTFNGKSLEGIDLSKKMFNSFMNNVNKGIYKCVDNNIFKSYLNGKNTDLVYKVIKGYWEKLKQLPTLYQVNNIWVTNYTDNVYINNVENTDSSDTNDDLPTGGTRSGRYGYILDSNYNIYVATSENGEFEVTIPITYWGSDNHIHHGKLYSSLVYPTEDSCPLPCEKSLCDYKLTYQRYQIPLDEPKINPETGEKEYYEIKDVLYHGYVQIEFPVDYNTYEMGNFDGGNNNLSEEDEWYGLTYEEAWIKAPHIIQELVNINGKRQIINYYKTKTIANDYQPIDINQYELKTTDKTFGTNYPYIFSFEYYYWSLINTSYNKGIGWPYETVSETDSETEYQYFNPAEFIEATEGSEKHFILWYIRMKSIYTEEEFAIWESEFNDFLEKSNVSEYEYDNHTYNWEIPACPGSPDEYILKSVVHWGITYYAWYSIYGVMGNSDLPSDLNDQGKERYNFKYKCSICGEPLPESITVPYDDNFSNDPNFDESDCIEITYYPVKPAEPTKNKDDYYDATYPYTDTHGDTHTYYTWISKTDVRNYTSRYDYNGKNNNGVGWFDPKPKN